MVSKHSSAFRFFYKSSVFIQFKHLLTVRSGLLPPLLLLLLWVASPPLYARQAVAANLRRFVGCAVREFTFLARKPGCGALHITTDACWGRCETWEVSGAHTHTHTQ